MKEFPVLPSMENGWKEASVPWSLVEAAREQIENNHGQTLERLAERGGLSYTEMYCGVKGLSLSATYRSGFPSQKQVEFVIKGMVKLFQEAHPL